MMPVLGHGIDIVDIGRFERVWRRFGDRLLDRVFSDKERQWCLDRPSPAKHLAVRFGAKEAFIKAFGSRKGIRWKDVEIVRSSEGRPFFILYGKARANAQKSGVKNMHLSLSHDGGIGIAGVILES